MRIEHWDNAIEQGVHAAERLLVDDADALPFEPVPWFWSDQYDRKLQMAGGSARRTTSISPPVRSRSDVLRSFTVGTGDW